jgi:hypothetical protein
MFTKLICLMSFVLVLVLVLAGVTSAGNNLIGWWKFDGDTLDSSGFGNDGTAFGDPTFIAGTVGSEALDFDGDDYVRMDGLADDITDNDCTFHAWVKTTDSAGDWFSCNTGTGGNVALWAIDSSQAAMYEGGYEARSTTNVSDGQWHMLTFTRAGSLGTTYVDGVAENTYTANFNFSATDRWSIAQEWDTDSPSDFLTGTVDDVRFYDRAISDAQVSGLFNGIDPTFVKAENPVPADGAMYEDTWVSLGWSPGDTAASHDVYFSDNLADVNDGTGDAFRGNTADTYFIAGFFGYPYPDGLVLGTTYYWRIDEVEADGTTTHRGDVWSFWTPPLTAYAPDPPDGARFVDLDVTLSWTPGFAGQLHIAYFGDNFDDVNNAAGGTATASTTYTPGTLARDTVYYWRVDEFNPPVTHRGDVWSFTTLPVISITDPNLIGWWTFDEGYGTTALDWSGHDNHATLVAGPQWVEGYMGGALEFNGSNYVTMDPVANDIKSNDITLAAWVNMTSDTAWYPIISCNTASGGNVGWLAVDDGYADFGDLTGTVYVTDNDWHHLAYTRIGNSGSLYVDGVLDGTHTPDFTFSASDLWSIGQEWDGGPSASNFLPGTVDDARIYDMGMTAEGIKLVMRGDLLVAWDPSPTNGSTAGIFAATTLTWSPGDNAAQHDVYFGTDIAAVDAADASDTTGVYRGRQGLTSYTPPEGIQMNTGPYYWRIDEFNTDGTISTGRLWSFTVGDYGVVDDFESYNDIPGGEPGSNLVYVAWKDGFDNPATNGSTMGYPSGASMETDTVHGGRQSAPMAYDNTTAPFSEVTRTFAVPQDWTKHDVQTLTLWFHGTAGNTGQLYVKVNGSKLVYDGDAADMRRAWQSWNIELASFGAS